MPGSCQLPSCAKKEAKDSFQRKRKPLGADEKVGLRSHSSGQSQCSAPLQGRSPWYFACWYSGTGKKAEELVSLRVEDWGKGFKTGEELEFEAATGWLLQEVLVPLCPQGFKCPAVTRALQAS